MNKFNYPKLERVDTEIGRHYRDSNNNLVPSVTTVLSAPQIIKMALKSGEKKLETVKQIVS